MRTPILGILIPYLVFSILFENQTFKQSTMMYLQGSYAVMLLGYYRYYRPKTNIVKISLNIVCSIILSFYLQFNYRNQVELNSTGNNYFPQREIILEIKIIQKVRNRRTTENFHIKYLGSVEKTPQFASRIINRRILCSIDYKLKESLKGKIIQVKGIMNFDDKNLLKIKRCKLISVKTNSTYSNVVSTLRSYIIKSFERVNVPENEISGFLNAIFLGNKDTLSEQEKENYQYSGTMHLFAVSGLHVGFLYLIFSFIFSGFCKNRIVKELFVLLMMIIYLELIYYPPSALRATMMVFVWQCTTIFSKRKNTFSSLFLSCLVLLIIDPSYVISIGFQLSYTVVFSILVYSKISREIQYERFNFFGKFLTSSLITSYSAFCGSMLLVYDYFNLIVPISIFVNLLAVPIAFLFVLNSFVMLLIQPIVGIEIFSQVFYFLYWLLEIIIHFCNFENVTYFKIQESKNISNIIHLIYPLSFVVYFLSEKGFIFKTFLFILIPIFFLFLFSFFI